jgi:glycosyltransferase involved in cell wall biosynthesis
MMTTTLSAAPQSEETAPLVSVVMPVFNGQGFLACAIDSVLWQTRGDWELVIVDDGSTDESPRIAEKYATVDSRVRVFHQENFGGGAARNRGLAETNPRSQYIAFLDADDVYEPDAIETLVRALEADRKAVAASGLARYIDAGGRLISPGEAEAWGRNRRTIRGLRSVLCLPDEPTTFVVLSHWNTIHTPGQALIRRQPLLSIGAIDESLATADYDMWLRLALLGEITFIDRVLLSYRRHAGGMSSESRRTRLDDWRIRRKILFSREIDAKGIRFFVMAKLYAVTSFRLRWFGEALRKGRVREAGSHLFRLLTEYARLSWLLLQRGVSQGRPPSSLLERRTAW